MAEKFLEPQNPLKKIDIETGDINYIYPQTTAKQVIVDDDGTRLNTILNENILYLGDAEDGGIIDTSLFNAVYPVGSIYMTVNPVSPASLFGGTWEPIYDRFLLAAGGNYPVGATGGEATHTLTVNEMPNHEHGVRVDWHDGSDMTTNTAVAGSTPITTNGGVAGNLAIDRPTGGQGTTNTGGSQPHNNMPPYLTVYMWKRIA